MTRTTEALMHGGPAPAIADARAALGYLADRASSVDAASDYERVLLTLDTYTADASPSASEDAELEDPRAAIAAARRALLAAEGGPITALQIEVLLVMLDDAVAGDLG